jgi:hypothetical protein
MHNELFARKRRAAIIHVSQVLIVGLSFSYGYVAHRNELPPSSLIKALVSSIRPLIDRTRASDASAVGATAATAALPPRIELADGNEVNQKRDQLIKHIWKNQPYPKAHFPSVEYDVFDERYSSVRDLDQIDRLTVDMEYGMSSMMYLFHSKSPNHKVVIYHEGHRGDFFLGLNTIVSLLGSGYDVIAVSMPLLGLNKQPTIHFPRFGSVTFASHDHFKMLDGPTFNSIKFFVEPVVMAVNYSLQSGYEEVDMIGFSGGGWTTVVSAAVEPRISNSYSVAGSYPIYLRSGQDPWDYEQSEIGLFRIANYLELYVLASYGEDRTHTQVVNYYDPCCFKGDKYRSYEGAVLETMKQLGKGKFTILADYSHREHKISGFALTSVLSDLTNR